MIPTFVRTFYKLLPVEHRVPSGNSRLTREHNSIKRPVRVMVLEQHTPSHCSSIKKYDANNSEWTDGSTYRRRVNYILCRNSSRSIKILLGHNMTIFNFILFFQVAECGSLLPILNTLQKTNIHNSHGIFCLMNFNLTQVPHIKLSKSFKTLTS